MRFSGRPLSMVSGVAVMMLFAYTLRDMPGEDRIPPSREPVDERIRADRRPLEVPESLEETALPGTLSIAVRGSRGNALLPAARVTVWDGESLEVHSAGPDGRVLIDGLAADGWVELVEVSAEGQPPRGRLHGDIPYLVGPGATGVALSVRLKGEEAEPGEASVRWQGHVEALSAPMPTVGWVAVMGPSWPLPRWQSLGEGGRFTISVPEGATHVRAFVPGLATERGALPERPQDGPAPELALSLTEEAVVEGLLAAEEGHPIPTFVVVLHVHDRDFLGPYHSAALVQHPEGRFRVGGLASGEYDMVVCAQGYRSALQTIRVARGEHIDLGGLTMRAAEVPLGLECGGVLLERP